MRGFYKKLSFLLILSCLCFPQNLFAAYNAIDAIETDFSQLTAFAFIDSRRTKNNTFQISFRGQNYDLSKYSNEFTPAFNSESGVVFGPGEKGFVIVFQQVDKEPPMEFQADGIALEENTTHTLWNETRYAIKLKEGFLLVMISYHKDVDWEPVADIEDEVLFVIDALRVNYNSK